MTSAAGPLTVLLGRAVPVGTVPLSTAPRTVRVGRTEQAVVRCRAGTQRSITLDRLAELVSAARTEATAGHGATARRCQPPAQLTKAGRKARSARELAPRSAVRAAAFAGALVENLERPTVMPTAGLRARAN